jgi:hypothetical protein
MKTLSKTVKLLASACIILPSFALADGQNAQVENANQSSGLPANPTPAQAQEYIDTSKDCMIVQNKNQIVLKCGKNMIFVTPEGVGIKTPGVSKFWS